MRSYRESVRSFEMLKSLSLRIGASGASSAGLVRALVATSTTAVYSSRKLLVESRMGAVAWGHWPTPRFPSPLIEPDVRSYRIRLSDWLHPRPTAGQVEAGVLGTALRGSDGSHRT